MTLCGLMSCAATFSFDKDLSPELAGLPALPVVLTEDLQDLTVFDDTQGLPTTYEIGKLLKRLFTGEDREFVIGPVNSRLEVGSANDWIFFLKWQATYRLTVSLQLAGSHQILSCVGTGTAGDTFTAARSASNDAIQNCALDLYRQVKALMEASRSSAPTPAEVHGE